MAALEKAARSCDGCVACCVLLQVPEIQKPQGVCCPKLDASRPGCSIHATRPTACRMWNCLWIEERVPEAARPKVCGVMFSEQATELTRSCIVATEIWDGALNTPDMDALITSLAEREVVITISRQGMAMLGPVDRRAEMIQQVQAHGVPSLEPMSDATYDRLQKMMGRQPQGDL